MQKSIYFKLVMAMESMVIIHNASKLNTFLKAYVCFQKLRHCRENMLHRPWNRCAIIRRSYSTDLNDYNIS